MVSILLAQDKACAVALLKIFAEKREYNANAMEAIANAYACNSESTIATPTNSICLKQSAYANIVPEKRPITSYSKIIDK